MKNPQDELFYLVRSRYGLILLLTVEEERAEALIRHLAERLSLPFFIWTADQGLRRDGAEMSIYGTQALNQALGHIEASKDPALYHFQGVAAWFSEGVPRDPALEAKLLAVVKKLSGREGAIIITGEEIPLSDTCKRYAASLKMPLPTEREYADILKVLYRDLSKKAAIPVRLDRNSLNRLIFNLKGLTLLETQKVLTRTMLEDGCLSADSIRRIVEAKKTIVEKDGLLEYYPVDKNFQDIADLTRLKAWLAKRRHCIDDRDAAEAAGLVFPKGILLLGVPGSGKSLCAKAVSVEWGIPLLKMDTSRLYSKYVGETEHNFRRAMDAAEKLSPTVLWIDEIEKAMAWGGEEDGGVSKRVLGSFLTWMQERRGDVFVVATSNDIQALPPELLRKGRFDEIFFLDLPDVESRREIFRIHLKRRKYALDTFDCESLARASEGFTGADIEQAICSALYSAVPEHHPLTTQAILNEIADTHPLSRTRAEALDALRAWARDRTVPAN
jgi:SpoVK/Ycf46/Vps4 family AAA+-type ATPase